LKEKETSFPAKAQRGKERSLRVEGQFILSAFFASSLCAFAPLRELLSSVVAQLNFKLTHYPFSIPFAPYSKSRV
jgi:hypothetical protein